MDDVIERLKEWAKSNELITAIVLTSSKVTGSTAPVDSFSDYDVSVYVKSIKDFMNDEWLGYFGKPMVFWPLTPQTTFDENWITRLVLFEDRTRIDFQITDKQDIVPADYDLGYQVLVDRVGLTEKFPESTKTQHFIKKPTEKEFLLLVNDFLWDVTYVAKYLWRGGIFYAKFMESTIRAEYFEKMIEWYIGLEYQWKVGTNVHGRYFPEYLDEGTWNEIKESFAGADAEESWKAFFKMFELFTRFARKVSAGLDYQYPNETEKKVFDYCRRSKELKREQF